MHGSLKRRQRIYIDRTHLRGRVTGIERVTMDLFSSEALAPHEVRSVTSRSVPEMILRQWVDLPLLALRDPEALFLFPGFPPAPLCAPAAGRDASRPRRASRRARLHRLRRVQVPESRLSRPNLPLLMVGAGGCLLLLPAGT